MALVQVLSTNTGEQSSHLNPDVWNQHLPHNKPKVRCYLPWKVTSPGTCREKEILWRWWSSRRDCIMAQKEEKEGVCVEKAEIGWRSEEFLKNRIRGNLKTTSGTSFKWTMESSTSSKSLCILEVTHPPSEIQIFIETRIKSDRIDKTPRKQAVLEERWLGCSPWPFPCWPLEIYLYWLGVAAEVAASRMLQSFPSKQAC